MILAIDIGNTNITLGGFVGDKPTFVARISTNAAQTSDEYATKILHTLALHRVEKATVQGAIISSVVPPLNSVMKNAIRLIYDVEPLLVGPGIKTGLKIRCDNPASVGSDLICASVAAHVLYGAPALIVDMGTATKMMVLDDTGAFVGVSIIPGVLMGLRALSDGTAQLPQVSLETPPCVIGKNTVDCMRAGVVYGNAGLIDAMIDRINDEIGMSLPVIATGGLSSTIIPLCRRDIRMDDTLVLKGLNILYHKNN